MRRVGDLEVDQDLVFERRSWAFQRAGWVVMTLLILAALLGLLGPGPASSAKAETSGGALVGEYDRLVRASGEGGRVTFSLTPRSIGPWRARLGVDGGPSLAFRQFVFP